MKLTICLLCLVILLFSSCTKKENKKEELPVVPLAASHNQFAVTEAKFAQNVKFLKREVSYITSTPLLKNVRLFSYDGSNRCTGIRIGTIDSSGANPLFNLKQTLTLNYNGSSIWPSSFSSVKTVFPNLVTVFYYRYNSQGLKTQDSVMVKNTVGDPAYRTVNYVYDKDQVYTTPVLSGFPMENIPFDTLSILETGNIGRLVSRIKMSAGDQLVTYAFIYDQSINPYNKLNIANSLYFENSTLGIGYNVPLETHYMGVTINNITSWTSGSYTASFRYVYDGDKYPLKKEMILPGNANSYQVTVFEY